jgi:hypothetical protein
MIAHNGEINTLRGNVNWMRARESQLASELFGDDLPRCSRSSRPGGSDSANVRQRARAARARRPLDPHAVMMMIPEAYRTRDQDLTRRRARLLRLPLLPDGAVGRARRRSSSPTARSPARCSTATACGPAAGSRTRTATSCSPPRPACSTVAPEHVQRKGRCSPASCSCSTSRRAGSSTTRRSSADRPRRSPTASGTSARSSTSTTCPSASRRCRGSSRCAPSSSPSATRRRT